jgi:ATP-dependent helicase/nuclease subunit A
MRTLYVALTRAKNHLLLFGTTTQKRAAESWSANGATNPLLQQMLKASSCLDWIGTFATLKSPLWLDEPAGIAAGFSYRVHSRLPATEFAESESRAVHRTLDEGLIAELRRKASFVYPHLSSTLQAAKTSVTNLRRRASEQDEESQRFPSSNRGSAEGAERGKAVHAFLEHLSLDGAFHPAALKKQAEKLIVDGVLSAGQDSLVDFEGVSSFWTSDVGREFLGERKHLHREFPITFKLTASDLERAGLGNSMQIPEGEFVVLQGVADLLLLRPADIWLLDFKSDAIRKADVSGAAERYRAQLALYGAALSAIYHRPVARKGIYFIHPREFAWI